ncbi:DUF4369 domain-containing protein [Spirosoma linguale]|uniref:DUF4369 domain-containing protein n=1 Tax=Spirosoma linguale (strain ATCC 33905 / DSM 74 / LMG 10896 / Claus 1) TaxID=504472 RepID=D2QVX3_SPILD|nr:hypothetical protein Slin_7012 [Spirosoma linguale DSM 74]
MRISLTLLILLYFAGSSIAQSLLTIRGKTDDLQSSQVYLFFVNPAQSDTTLVDSATVTRQQFSFKKSLQEPKQAFLRLRNHSKKVAFLWDNPIEVNFSDRSPTSSSVTNSVATTEWYDFTAGIDSTHEQQVVVFANQKAALLRQKPQKGVTYDSNRVMSFVRTGIDLMQVRRRQLITFRERHPLSWVNLYLLCWYRSELGRASVYQLMRQLPTHLKESALYGQLDLALQEM